MNCKRSYRRLKLGTDQVKVRLGLACVIPLRYSPAKEVCLNKNHLQRPETNLFMHSVSDVQSVAKSYLVSSVLHHSRVQIMHQVNSSIKLPMRIISYHRCSKQSICFKKACTARDTRNRKVNPNPKTRSKLACCMMETATSCPFGACTI